MHAIIVLVCAARPSAALPIERVSHWGGEVRLIHIDGALAYVGMGPNLFVFDISDPDYPIELSATYVDSVLNGIAIQDEVAYVAPDCGEYELRMFDISDPSNPIQIGTFDESGCTPRYAPVPAGDVLYLGEESGVLTFDARDPANLIVLDELTGCVVPDCWDEVTQMVNQGAILFMIDDNHFRTVDATDRFHPEYMSSLQLGNAIAEGFDLVGNRAYVATRSGFTVVDTTDPADMTILGEYPLDFAGGVAIDNNLAYVAAGLDGLLVLDVTDPANIAQVGVMPSDSGIERITRSGSMAYISERDTGFVIVDLSNPLVPVRRGHVRSPDLARGMTKRGNYLYALDEIFGISILDVSDPWNPTLAGLWEGGVGNWYIRFRDLLGYFSAGIAGFQILDFSDPVDPSFVGGFVTGGNVSGMSESNGIVIAGHTSPHAAVVLDTSDVQNPTPIGTILYNSITDVDFNGDIAYLSLDGFRAMDMTDPAQPVECQQGDDWTTSSTELLGNLLYVTADGSFRGLAVADVSDPCIPVELGRISVTNDPFFVDVTVVGRRAYCGVNSGSTLAIIDVGDPSNLSVIGEKPTLNSTPFLEVDEPYVYLADGASGFGIYRVPAQGDADWDFDVDRFDYLQMFACLTGPAGGVAPECDDMDFYDVGQGIDLRDFSLFQENYTGEEKPK